MGKLLSLKSAWLLLACLTASSCAARRPTAQTWRLLNNPLLLPPDLTTADIETRSFKTALPAGHGPCPPNSEAITLKTKGKTATITVNRAALSQQRGGWLSNWAASLESQKCLPRIQAFQLAEQIAVSVPLDPSMAYRLLQTDNMLGGTVGLGTSDYLMVVSPLMKDSTKPLIENETLSGNGVTLNLTAKSTDNLIGFERALYKVQRIPNGNGYSITPQYADRHIDGKIERNAQPVTNYFRFPPEGAHFRVFYKTGENDFTALVVAARTPDELDVRTGKLSASNSAALCQKESENMCILIPKAVAINPVVAVSINGEEKFQIRGTSLQTALQLSGQTKLETILPRLKITKPWKGQPTPVQFDPTSSAILELILQGGETISWN